MKSKVIFVQSQGLGRGDDSLGLMLMANFLRLLGESKDKVKSIIFWNAGVHLLCEGSEVLEHIKKLENQGVDILACITCLEYFDLIDKLVVGKQTTMMKSIESMLDSDVISL